MSARMRQVLQQTKKIQCDIQLNRRPNWQRDSCFGYPSTLVHRCLPQKILAFAVTRRGTTHATTQEAHLWWTVTHLTMHKARNLPSFFSPNTHSTTLNEVHQMLRNVHTEKQAERLAATNHKAAQRPTSLARQP